jgi:hypothetical protein
MIEMLLDRERDAIVPEEYLIINNEVDFLEAAGTTNVPLHIRGAVLCDWAEAFFQARGIPYRYTESPTRELIAACPTLDVQHAQALFKRLGDIFVRLPRPLSLVALLAYFYPVRLWRETPSKQHAADWLIWLYEHDVEEALQPLVTAICDEWLPQVKVLERAPYEARDAESALIVLEGWLGLREESTFEALGEFPLPVPSSIRTRAQKVWRRRLIETTGTYFGELVTRKLPPVMKQLAANEAAEYYKVHPECLTETAFMILSSYLSSSEQTDLRRWLHPKLPTAIPSTSSEVLDWFKNEYLPYRLWQSHKDVAAATSTVQTAASEFAAWYLEHYSAALAGGKMLTHLSFMRSAALANSTSGAVTLLIVLDGLHVADARDLQLAVQKRSSRLTIVDDGLAFAPIPTITQFSKPALLHGVPPDQVNQVSPIGQILPERESPVERLKLAKPGTVYVWRVMEPDNTYHKRNSYDTLRRAIEGQLDTIASNIVDIVNQVPDEIHLRLVLTTDHGRLLSDSERTRPVPDGMEVHGRTAWGRCSKNLDSGYYVEDHIAYLHYASFGLPVDTAVIFDESAFTTRDGKRGYEHFPHGGLFPEEVIIPWIVYERDVVAPEIEIIISGRGYAAKQGTIEIRVTNLGDVGLTIQRLELYTDEIRREVHLDWYIKPRVSQTQSRTLAHWPSVTELRTIKSSIKMKIASGLEFNVSATLELQSDEMYQRDDILEGLDL